MVQQISSGVKLEVDDVLQPLSTIRDALVRPEANLISLTTLRLLLIFHLRRLRTPWKPFELPSSKSRAALDVSIYNIPYTSVRLEIDEEARKLAFQLSDLIAIDEEACLLLLNSYDRNALDDVHGDSEGKLERVSLWYAEEALAAPQIILALYRLSEHGRGEWAEMAIELRTMVVENESRYLEGLFRAFSGLAQTQVQGSRRSDDALFWATHQLRLQDAFLHLLFLVMSSITGRTANVSEGLLKGAIMSSFGTYQANREIWEADPEAQRLQTRIRDMLLVVALDSLCLSEIVTTADGGEPPEGSLLRSRDKIIAVHLFLLDQSKDLAAPSSDQHSEVFPVWPMPIICLAWSIVLWSLKPDMLPPSPGYEGPAYQVFASRGLRLPSGLFPWLEEVLTGPLFAPGRYATVGDAPEEGAISRRVVMKDMMTGLADIMQFESIVDRSGLYRVWELLFGGGSPSTSMTLCNDFWQTDLQNPNRRAVLDKASFPSDTVSLPRILAALAGPRSESLNPPAATESAASMVHDYYSRLSSITLSIQSSNYRFSGKDAQGRALVSASKDLFLPGGSRIPQGSQGFILRHEEEVNPMVAWQAEVSGWGLLIEILRAAAGLREVEIRNQAPTAANFTHLTVAELGIHGSSEEILAAGLQLILAVLQQTPTVTTDIINSISLGKPGELVLLQLAMAVLNYTRSSLDSGSSDAATLFRMATLAVDLLQALLALSSEHIDASFRKTAFFGTQGARRSLALSLIQADSASDDHTLTLALLRLVSTLVNMRDSDNTLAVSALHLSFTEVWSQYSAWRYDDLSSKYELGTAIASLYDGLLRHPLDPKTMEPSASAKYLMETFVHSASPLSYRPFTEVITQSGPLIKKLVATRRLSSAEIVVAGFEQSIGFFATLVEIATKLGTSGNVLPMSFLVTPVQLVNTLFDVSVLPSTHQSTKRSILRLLATWLIANSADQQRHSLAGVLTDAQRSCRSLGRLSSDTKSRDIRSYVWQLLGTVVSTQPGCASFCIDSRSGKISGILLEAIEQVGAFETIIVHDPHALVAVLGYLQAVITCPGIAKEISTLRNHEGFWQAVYDISTYPVPAPPTFTLSMHSEGFAVRIRQYAYQVQAKANATALLASELSAVLESEQEGETRAQSMVLSLFRNGSMLEEVAVAAINSSCSPDLHEAEAKMLASCGVSLPVLRSVSPPTAREFGRTYLYGKRLASAHHTPDDDTSDGIPKATRLADQAAADLALDVLNLNWSMLDADLALTKSFRALSAGISAWTEGDGLAAKAARRAAETIVDLLGDEDRNGDIMLAIQTERLDMLAVLLETALDPDIETDSALIRNLAGALGRILETQTFSPMIGLRHPELPSIHKPVLRILFLFLRSLSNHQSADLKIDNTLEAGATFTLAAADVVLDAIIRGQPDSSGDLSQITAALCEIIRSPSPTVWLDKITEHDLIARSIEVVVRSRIINGLVPTHLCNVLILHLSLASHPLSAEKLAVSGILPAYSDNAIALEAEQGQIASVVSSLPNTVHSAWCGMLLVVKALLSCLPERDRPSFVRSDVIPFLRVSTVQLLRSLSWDGETPLSQSAMDELELTADVFYAVSRAVGPAGGLLQDFTPPALTLLQSLRHVLSHPRLLSTLVVPINEDERVAFAEELKGMDEETDVKLLDFGKTPVLAARTAGLMRVLRTMLLALVSFTRAWDVVEGEEAGSELLLLSEEDNLVSVSDDPVGIINDIYLFASTLLNRLHSNSDAEEERAAQQVVTQINESAALLSTSQLILRQAFQPEGQKPSNDDGMDVDSGGKRRVSFGKLGPEGRTAHILRDLVGDLRGMLPGTNDGSGDQEMLVWLKGLSEKNFAPD